MKQTILKELEFKVSNFSKPFKVHTNALDHALGGALVHKKIKKNHSIAIESRKLKDVEQRYSTLENEMIVVVHSLDTWRHYLLETKLLW